MRNIFYFLFCNKKLKFLTNQNSRITTKFLSSLIKIIKHFYQEKKKVKTTTNLHVYK